MAENNKKKLKRKKTVDSFIISDNLSEESCSPFYQKFIANNIKANKRSVKKKYTDHSECDGLFTPLLRKKLTFDNSGKENDTSHKMDSKPRNKRKFISFHDSDTSAKNKVEKSLNYLNSPVLDQLDVADDYDTSIYRGHDLFKINTTTSAKDTLEKSLNYLNSPVLDHLHESNICNSSHSSITGNVKEGLSERSTEFFTPKRTVKVPKESICSPKLTDYTPNPITPIAKITIKKSSNYLNSPVLDKSDDDDDNYNTPIDRKHELIKINKSKPLDDITEVRSNKRKCTLLHESDISNNSDSSFTCNVGEGSLKMTPKVFTPKTTVKVPKKSICSPKLTDCTPNPITPSAKINLLKSLIAKFNDPPGSAYHSFLKSLSDVTDSSLEVHPEAVRYKMEYKKLKGDLTSTLFKLYNWEVFGNKLPSDTAIVWNTRMRKSSANCWNGRIAKIVDGRKNIVKISRISLSTKILTTPDRLRDTLMHELCHSACWIINNKNDGHGTIWKSWVAKATRRFPELCKIARRHNYSINFKYKYRCVRCGYSVGRHSKSLNLQRKRCGNCYGEFVLLFNQNGTGTTKLSKPRQLPKFALFVKENYGNIKKENSTLKHGQIMKLLGVKFAAVKNIV